MRLEHLDSGTSGELETMEKLYRRAKAKMMEEGRCDKGNLDSEVNEVVFPDSFSWQLHD